MENNGKRNEDTSRWDHQARAATPTIWEHALGRQLCQARSACLQGLGDIPTGLGRLAYVAILQQRLLEDHEELFKEWLGCSLEQKYEWLYRLSVNASCDGALPDEWLSSSVYSELVPNSAASSARDLHRSAIEAVLAILRQEVSGHSKPGKDEGLGDTQKFVA